MYENEHAAALEEDALHNLTAVRRSGAHGDGWNASRPADIPIWHMRPGMQIPYAGRGDNAVYTVASAPQHDADWRNEHVLVRSNTTGETSVFSRPYRSFVFVQAPAWQLSSEYFTATHDSTPHPRPAAPSRSRAVRAAATTGRTVR